MGPKKKKVKKLLKPTKPQLETEESNSKQQQKKKSKAPKLQSSPADASTNSISDDDVSALMDDESLNASSDEEEIVDANEFEDGDVSDDDNDLETKANATETSDKALSTKKPKVYIPGQSRALKKDEELVADVSAYVLLHQFQANMACLSFDSIPDTLGENRTDFPMTCYLVAGTQAEKPRDNELLVMKLHNLQSTSEESDSESSSDSSSEDDEGPSNRMRTKKTRYRLYASQIPHHGGINRIRVTRLGHTVVCASWNDQGKVHVWNLSGALRAVDLLEGKSKAEKLKKEKPLFTFPGHQHEGFAIDWSTLQEGSLLTGDCRRNIHVWRMKEGGDADFPKILSDWKNMLRLPADEAYSTCEWDVDQRPYNAHKGSVEEVQWSPSEQEVFASCSADRTIRLWDARVKPHEACVHTVDNAHEADVNVMSWNTKETTLLCSGGDDGYLKVWDLRMIETGQSVAQFKQHTGAICSVQWSPHDSTVIACAGEDNIVTIWDLAMEADPDAMASGDSDVATVPPQLLFIHQGQNEVKEVRWFPQLPGVLGTTALDGFNVFKPISSA